MIKTIARAVLLTVVAASLNVVFTTPAHATPIGRACGFASITDPTVENGQTQTGQINGGPVTDDTHVAATITLTCTIQVGGANATHAGTDSVSLTGTGTGTASVVGQASYVSPEGQPVYVCTEVTVNGTTYYRDSINATWSVSAGVECGLSISQEILPGLLGPLLDVLCSTIGTLAPLLGSPVDILPDGDIELRDTPPIQDIPVVRDLYDLLADLIRTVWDCPTPLSAVVMIVSDLVEVG